MDDPKNPLMTLPSTKEQGIHYHIGIIDYLQGWNIKKKAEKLSKKFINFDLSTDVSS